MLNVSAQLTDEHGVASQLQIVEPRLVRPLQKLALSISTFQAFLTCRELRH